MSRLVSRLLRDLLPDAETGSTGGRTVLSITADSRAAGPGALFFALAGAKSDGLVFARQATLAGAIAVVADRDRPADFPSTGLFLRVPDARRALAIASARFVGTQPRRIVAVTGTSGKTSVADFTRQIFATACLDAASLGTLGVVTSAGVRYGALTTPDPVSLHTMLAGLANEGITHLAMEASSHGIEQRRLDGVTLHAAAFTNLSRDHLDYHPTMAAYLDAKLRLFDTLLQPGQVAVIDADDGVSKQVIATARRRGLAVMSVGRGGEALRLVSQSRDGFTQVLTIDVGGVIHDIRLPLAGDFQASNALVAAGLAIASGLAPEIALAALATLKGAPGRLELVAERDGALGLVDYAHKPEALATVLDTLRPYASGRLIVVFGCGGDRDAGKRPIMGAIAHDKADIVIVTDDNPRSEKPAAIRGAILAAAPGATEIADRRAAIEAATDMLRPGDVLVVAGKGHESGQIVGDITLPFSDRDELTRAMQR